ncbi:hypothetical protein V6N11_053901 [Hibiscus sabdariffa]|uniref:Uncharacterized protein n=1 Tax=Hibiscus sabdariffa TaxID=183260 RepID=A0ABR2S2A0_9ROSI
MATPVWFLTLVLSYVSIGVGVGFVSTVAAGPVMSATASSLEMEAEALLHTGELEKLNLSCFLNLVYIDLSLSSTNGSISPQIGDLSSSLRYLDLSHNSVTELGNMTSLVELHLEENRLKGRISSSISNLSNLEALQLDSNPFRGPIPHEIGNMKNPGAFQFPMNLET